MDCLSFEKTRDNSQRCLLIYDISSNRKRAKFAKLMESYGTRVQKSAFELKVSRSSYRQLLAEVRKLTGEDDSVRIYSLREDTLLYGKKADEAQRADVMIV